MIMKRTEEMFQDYSPEFIRGWAPMIGLLRLKPDRIILIDYPGFNLRLAKRIQHLKIPITYFIFDCCPNLFQIDDLIWKMGRL